MQSMGLTAPELEAYDAATRAPFRDVRWDLQVLDLDEHQLTAIKPTANSGQVEIDTAGDVTRSLTLSFLDPARSLQFDPDSPSDGALYFTNMVKVRHGLFVRELQRRVWSSAFTGPLSKFDRTGSVVSIEAQGKEALALSGVPPLTIPKGTNAIEAIRTILSVCTGETRFAFPTGTQRLPKAVTVGWVDELFPWTVCRAIADSIGMQLFYDGDGVCRLRDQPGQPVWTLRDGPDGNVTAVVQVSHDKSTLRNRVKVVGAKPKDTAVALLPATHPFNLVRNGVKLYSSEEIDDDKIGSKSGAQSRADKAIAPYKSLDFDASLNIIPLTHLDELDLLRIDTQDYTGTERLHTASIPVSGGDMTFGYTDAVAVAATAVRKP